LALGEHQHGLAELEPFQHRLNAVLAHIAVDGNRVQTADQRADYGNLEERAAGEEREIAIRGGADEHGVEHGLVVGDDEHGAAARHVFPAAVAVAEAEEVERERHEIGEVVPAAADQAWAVGHRRATSSISFASTSSA